MSSFKTISVIIPAPPGEKAELALNSLKLVDYPRGSIEILLVEGKQPSRQRNRAAQEARGDIIYFLDSDSVVERSLFRLVSGQYKDPAVVAVGGPSLTPESDSYLQKAFGYVLASWFGCFSTRCRFASVGGVREGTERSFILCNFSIRREIFLKEKGFNEELYPNEENEFVNRLRVKKYRLIYHPEALVCKSMRPSLKEFVKQIFSYGRGRMEHALISPFVSNLVYLVPLAFSIYFFGLLLFRSLLYSFPFFLYLTLGFAFAAQASLAARNPGLFLLLPALYLIEHLAYGTGLAWGLLKRLLGISRRDSGEVKVYRLKILEEKPEAEQVILDLQLPERGWPQ